MTCVYSRISPVKLIYKMNKSRRMANLEKIQNIVHHKQYQVGSLDNIKFDVVIAKQEAYFDIMAGTCT